MFSPFIIHICSGVLLAKFHLQVITCPSHSTRSAILARLARMALPVEWEDAKTVKSIILNSFHNCCPEQNQDSVSKKTEEERILSRQLIVSALNTQQIN